MQVFSKRTIYSFVLLKVLIGFLHSKIDPIIGLDWPRHSGKGEVRLTPLETGRGIASGLRTHETGAKNKLWNLMFGAFMKGPNCGDVFGRQ